VLIYSSSLNTSLLFIAVISSLETKYELISLFVPLNIQNNPDML